MSESLGFRNQTPLVPVSYLQRYPMKRITTFLVFLASVASSSFAQRQPTDMAVEVSGARLHFHIVRGTGVPILFEAGGGDDGTVWSDLLKPLAQITGTTLISYDRAGFGQSEITDLNPDLERHGILNGVDELEMGLKTLGYDGDIMLVSHSYGGFYSELYAFRHPEKVKSVVLIDANHVCWYPPAYTAMMEADLQPEIARLKGTNPGKYYQFINFPETVAVMRVSPFPRSIPTIDLVSEHPPFDAAEDRERWEKCHHEFAQGALNREGIVAYGTGHYIFRENPGLVINSIVKAYSQILPLAQRDAVLQRGLSYAVVAANNSKKSEAAYLNSEDDLNSWGYSLLKQGELQRALGVLKLNVEMHPDSWNAYDSYGEVLIKAGKKEQALEMYRKSVQLNPKSEHGLQVIEQLSSP
jgi:pimeloyl-ACP methyl ester carboxylesterase